MAKRYLRTVRLQRCPAAAVPARGEELRTQIETMLTAWLQAHGDWQSRDAHEATGGHPLYNRELRQGTFRAQVCVSLQSDMRAVPAQAPVRDFSIAVKALCFHEKRRQARELRGNLTYQLAGVGGVLGGLVGAGLMVLGEGLLLGWFRIRDAVLAFFGGMALGGVIGHLIGDRLGDHFAKNLEQTSAAEDAGHEQAAAAWEQFIEALAGEVDIFAQQVEETPSSATIT